MARMDNTECFFCGSHLKPCNLSLGCFDGSIYDCPICGTYYLSFISYINGGREFCNQPERLKISKVLAERMLHHKPHVAFMLNGKDNSPLDNPPDLSMFNYEVLSLNQVLEQYPQDALEMSERILLSISTLAPTPFCKLCLDQFPYHALFCSTSEELRNVLDYCETAQWIKKGRAMDGNTNNFSIIPSGWERVKELRKRIPGEKPQIFVAMWFSPEVDETFIAIKETVEAEGQLKAYRIDKQEYNNNICDEMFAEIQRSSALIADYSGNRPNVYYEAGYARGLGIPVIMLIPKSDWDDNDKKPHFDIAQYNFITYEKIDELKQRLRQRLRAMFPQIQ